MIRACRTVFALLSLALSLTGPQTASAADAASAADLRARHEQLAPGLAKTAFGRPLTIDSDESSGRLSGEIYAVLDQPFAAMKPLSTSAAWCEVLMLHINTKRCLVETKDGQDTLALNVGRKTEQDIKDTQRVAFAFRVNAATADFLDVRLAADSGPLSTRDYRIALQATPIAGGRSFIHMSYSYGFGMAAKIAMKGYLATVGNDKIGFSTPPGDPTGHIGGVRGVVERNTMRYYLAIDAYLAAPAAGQLDQRLTRWFDATEQYAPQLHEVERPAYLAMKHNEFKRQAAGPETAER